MGTGRSATRGGLALLLLLGASAALPPGPALAQGYEIEEGDTVIREDGNFILIKADGTIIAIGQPGEEEPGFGGLSGGSPPPAPEPAPPPTAQDTSCDPSTFKLNGGSTFFRLHHCPSPAGWDAKDRVAEVIDAAWLFVSQRFGSDYGTGKLDAYIYTTGSHYHSQSGASAWSGGYYTAGSDEVHVPAPPGKEGFALESLLAHELTHFRLEQLTWNDAIGGGAIRYFRFLNEGIAQRVEESLYEARSPPPGAPDVRRRKLWVLKQVLEQGHDLMDYRSMQGGVVGGPSVYYAQSWATVAYLEEAEGTYALDALLAGMKDLPRPRTRSQLASQLEELFRSALGTDADTLRSRVQAWARRQVAREFP